MLDASHSLTGEGANSRLEKAWYKRHIINHIAVAFSLFKQDGGFIRAADA